jgi:hypothetical protein
MTCGRIVREIKQGLDDGIGELGEFSRHFLAPQRPGVCTEWQNSVKNQ